MYDIELAFMDGVGEIPYITQDGEYYIPLQLLSDVILSHYSVNTLFNGENLCIIGGGETAPLEEQIFIDNPPKERSDALIDFNYRELCFALDAIYGLKEQHNIKDFDSLFKHTGFKGQSYMMKEPVTLNFGTSIQQSLDDKTNLTVLFISK